ncbi:hypothetical protein APHAL10511_002662 [Amanita phalloides]|nr:hypothetical protein APHAL10511_002662 [Amanita phalloides]
MELIDSHVSLRQCEKAINALHSHQIKKQAELQENELLSGKEEFIWLTVTVKKVSPTRRIKPIRIPIVYPIVDPRTTAVCLITKDPQREYKDLLETHKIKFISRVIGLTKLKGKFGPFEARRALLKTYGLFLADDRIIPTLPKLLGSKWFEAKKQPIPVNLTKKGLKKELERAISSTYMNQNRGTCTAIRIGNLSQKPSQMLENLKIALPAIVQHIKDGWDNVQSLYIKTSSSVSLPVWTCSLDDAKEGRWDGLTAEVEGKDGGLGGTENGGGRSENESANEGLDDEDGRSHNDGEVEPDVAPVLEVRRQSSGLKASGKKRMSEDHRDEEDKPKKKPKKGEGDGLKQKPGAQGSLSEAPPTKSTMAKQTAKISKNKDKVDHTSKVDTAAVKTAKAVIKGVYPFTDTRTSSVTMAEIKQKRMKDPGERKKEKLLSSRGSKSVKAKVTGRKAVSRYAV